MARALQRLFIGDDPTAWAAAGFTVTDNTVVLGKTCVELTGSSGDRGIVGWSIDGVVSDIDGLPSVIIPTHEQRSPVEHPNMVFAIDHVVVASDVPSRTAAAFEDIGIDQRKQLTFTDPKGDEREQRFFWAGRVIVELIGPATPPPTPKPDASFWGLALASANLEIATSVLGDALGEPKDAVQPGRKIATLRTRDLDISVPIALMSPHVANLGEPDEELAAEG